MIKNQFGRAGDPLSEKSFALAVRAIRLQQYLAKEKGELSISKQMLRAGTNPGAMVRESKMAESSADFIHKLSIAQKEANEFDYWLDLLHSSGYITSEQHLSLKADTEEVFKLLSASILTVKKKTPPKKP